MVEKKRWSPNWNIEEKRALYVIGVLAVLLASQNYYKDRWVYFGLVSIKADGLVDIILISWGAYAFLMAFGASSDLLPDFVSDFFHRLSVGLFLVGGFLLGYTVFSFIIIGFSDRLHLVLLPVIPLFFYYLVHYPIKIPKIQFQFTIETFFRIFSGTASATWMVLFALSTLSLFKANVTVFIPIRYQTNLPYLSFFIGLLFVILEILRKRYLSSTSPPSEKSEDKTTEG